MDNKRDKETEVKVKCKWGEDVELFSLKITTTLQEFLQKVEREWGKGKGVKYQDKEGDWIKIKTNNDLKRVWEDAMQVRVTLKVFFTQPTLARCSFPPPLSLSYVSFIF